MSQRIRKLVYGRADGMPNSLDSIVVCGFSLFMIAYIRNGSTSVLNLPSNRCLNMNARYAMSYIISGALRSHILHTNFFGATGMWRLLFFAMTIGVLLHTPPPRPYPFPTTSYVVF
jgi:hypothetical protein